MRKKLYDKATQSLLLQEIQIGFTFLVPAHPGIPGQNPQRCKTVAVLVVVVVVVVVVVSSSSKLLTASRISFQDENIWINQINFFMDD